MRKRPPHLRSLLSLFVIGIVATLLIFAGADSLCRYDISRRLPYYPNAKLISSETDSFRLRALGNSLMVFETTDDQETVAVWYRQLTLEQLDKGIMRGLADIRRFYETSDRGTTVIYYQTSCGL